MTVCVTDKYKTLSPMTLESRDVRFKPGTEKNCLDIWTALQIISILEENQNIKVCQVQKYEDRGSHPLKRQNFVKIFIRW